MCLGRLSRSQGGEYIYEGGGGQRESRKASRGRWSRSEVKKRKLRYVPYGMEIQPLTVVLLVRSLSMIPSW